MLLTLIFLIFTTVVPNGQCLLLDIMDGRVVGGERARIAEFPHQISLRYDKRHTCGGSIIDKYYILTAAHCVYGRSRPKRFTVVSGTNHLYKGGNHHEVESIRYPNRYTPRSLNHDVAVLKLKKPIVFGTYQKPIALTMRDTPRGLMVKLTGWGLLSYPNDTLPDDLQKVDVFTYSNSVCQRLHNRNRNPFQQPSIIYPGMLCAFNMHSVGACKGDSGGPLILNTRNGPVQIGVVSWVWRYCALGVPDVYARVYYYLNWINKQTNYSIFEAEDNRNRNRI